jgi:hypothetical protein
MRQEFDSIGFSLKEMNSFSAGAGAPENLTRSHIQFRTWSPPLVMKFPTTPFVNDECTGPPRVPKLRFSRGGGRWVTFSGACDEARAAAGSGPGERDRVGPFRSATALIQLALKLPRFQDFSVNQ